MQDWEALKIILSNINRDIDVLRADVVSLEKLHRESGEKQVLLEEKIRVLEKGLETRATGLEHQIKELKKEIHKKIGENKKGLSIITAVLIGAAIAKDQVDYKAIIKSIISKLFP